MKNIFYLVIVVFSIAVPATSVSQNNVRLKLNYNIAAPLGNFKQNYISNTSFRGGNGEISYWFNIHAAAGLSVGFQSFQQKFPRQTYKLDGNQTISAVLTNTVETMPVMITGTFAPLARTGKAIQPYLSAGAGVNLVNFRQYYGEFSDGESSASFAAQAGAGLMVPLGTKLNNAALQFGSTFNYMPYKRNGLTHLNSAGFNAGVVVPLK